jgi:exopolyphosphatase / guanosine-5'-triphosphate,3'-diphosphate pyrophosphatase
VLVQYGGTQLKDAMSKLAVLDIGTNSIHMVLAEIEPDFSYKILDRFKDVTRLGDGTFRTHRLPDAAMRRGLEVIKTQVTLARNKGYKRIKAVATSAVREATNGGEFLKAVSKKTGLPVRVVTGQEEARLIYLGVRHSMELSEQPALIVDIGGGSVELIAGNRDAMVQGESLKLGAIRLKDLHLHRDPPPESVMEKLQHAIETEIAAALQRLKVKEFGKIIGTSGMISNLAEVIHLRRTGRPVPQLNLATIELKEIEQTEELLKKTSLRERLTIPGLDPKRADLLLPVVMVLRTLLQQVGHETVTIGDKAIREGIIYDFIQRHQEGIRAEQEIPNVRRRTILNLAQRCRYPQAHSHHVAKLAVQLFDQTAALHKLGEREREWLEYAALLHDIGYLINARQHHKHAYYLITNSDLDGLTSEEIEIVANITRYHRRALPETKHKSYEALSLKSRRTVQKLSALLRIADGLDRSQFAVVQKLKVKLGNPVGIILYTTSDPELEIWAARTRADLFVRVFRRAVSFSNHPYHGESA